MNNTAQELSDVQLDAISGGCYRPEPKKCEPSYDPCKKWEDDYDYGCRKEEKKNHSKSPWEKWYDRCHDYFENKY